MDTSNDIKWSLDRAAVAYSFLANLSIFLGYSTKQKEYLEELYQHLFGTQELSKDSFEYKMLVSLGKLPATYHIGEIKNFSSQQKKQIKSWSFDLYGLDPMMEVNSAMLLQLTPINKFIVTL